MGYEVEGVEGVVGVELDFGKVEGSEGRIIILEGRLVLGEVLWDLLELIRVKQWTDILF